MEHKTAKRERGKKVFAVGVANVVKSLYCAWWADLREM